MGVLMKKLIFIVPIFSLLLYLTGCYGMIEVTKEEFSSQKEFDNALLVTKEDKEYLFNDMEYIINSDTLSGTGLSLSRNNDTPFVGKIALDDVMTFKVYKLDVESTILVSTMILGLVIVTVANWNSMVGLSWQ
jgi:hypothetical protein